MRVVDGDEPPRDVEVVDGLLIGRHTDCELVLKDNHVSKRHAKIIVVGSDLAIADLGSNNGTIINGDHVLHEGEECLLQHGLRIQIGYAEITVEGPPLPEPEESRAPETRLSEATTPADDADDSPLGDATLEGDAAWDELQDDPARLQETVRAVSPFHSSSRPAPAPETPARPKSSALPTRRASDSTDADFAGYDLRTIIAESDHAVGSDARLTSMEARFVVVNEADLRIVPLDELVFTIGRSEKSSLQLLNRGVSLDHAFIRFHPTSNTFTLQDVGSANGTLLANAPLPAGSPRELEPDSHVRFGTIEGVFMQGLDSEFHRLPSNRHDDAAKLLKSRGKLSAQTIKLGNKSAEEQGTSLGEALLLGQYVTPRDWCLAVKDARLAANLAALSGSRSKKNLLIPLFIVVAIALAALAWWLQLPANER